jgi:phosphate transport system protein
VPKPLLNELERVHRDLLRLAGLVEEAVHKTVGALEERDEALAREVVAGDDPIDEMENRVDEECYRIMALYQPVAGDLRRMIAVTMITSDLERMGDLARAIAERAICLTRPPLMPVPERIHRMAELTTAMVRDSLDAFVRSDADLARRVCGRDDEVDRCNAEVIEGLIATMRRSPDLIEPGLSWFSAVRHLERIADHATNIAEDVIYMVEGRIARHCPDALKPAGA